MHCNAGYRGTPHTEKYAIRSPPSRPSPVVYSRVSDLQNVSSQGEETSETGTRGSEGLIGGACEGTSGGGGSGSGCGDGGLAGSCGGGGGGAVGVGWAGGWGAGDGWGSATSPLVG